MPLSDHDAEQADHLNDERAERRAFDDEQPDPRDVDPEEAFAFDMHCVKTILARSGDRLEREQEYWWA